MKYKKRDGLGEAVIQAELYEACKNAGLDCTLQYVINPNQQHVPEEYRKETSIFDLIVSVGCEVVAIVEVKATGTSFTENSDQIKKYKKQNLPVFILHTIYDIPYLVKRLLEVKAKFLESMDSEQIKCFEADKQNEDKWDIKIAAAFIEFDETFPDYKFTNDQSLEIIATGVRVLGLTDVLKLMDEFKSKLAEFFPMLNAQINYTKTGRDRFLNTRKGNVQSITTYQNRQDRIDEKLK